MSYRIGPRGRRIFLSEKLKMPNIIYIRRSKIVERGSGEKAKSRVSPAGTWIRDIRDRQLDSSAVRIDGS